MYDGIPNVALFYPCFICSLISAVGLFMSDARNYVCATGAARCTEKKKHQETLNK